MNKLIILTGVFVCLVQLSIGQMTTQEFMSKVEHDNPFIQEQRVGVLARIEGSKVDINPSNPEVSYGYMPGIQNTDGVRQSYELTQNFDWIGSYFAKSKYGKLERKQASVDFLVARQQILLRIKELCYDVVYLQKMELLLMERLDYAKKLHSSIKEQFNNGATTSLELNRAVINLTQEQSLSSKNASELTVKRQQLSMLSGIELVSTSNFTYIEDISENLDSVYVSALGADHSIESSILENAKSEKNISIQRSATLPSISIGAAGERISATDSYLGVKAGLSIPLWAGKNKVKSAKMEYVTTQLRSENTKIEVESALKEIIANVKQLRKTLLDYNELSDVREGVYLLNISLTTGNISIIDYLTQIVFYNTEQQRYFETELNLQKSLANLTKYR